METRSSLSFGFFINYTSIHFDLTEYPIFAHKSHIMKNFYLFIVLILNMGLSAQDHNPFYQSIVDQVDTEILNQNLETHESFGYKYPGSNGLINSFNWLKEKYEAWGYNDIQIDTFYFQGNECYNLIVTKSGLLFPNEYLIIDGHYDTWNGPGANDNGTGTAIVLECARLLKDLDTEYSIRFIHFSAEEVGLVGSSHYVDETVVPEDHQIKLVFNIDAVGGVNGMVNNIIVCEQDESFPHTNDLASSQFTDTLSVLMEMYSELYTEISYAYATDYVPFMEAGYIITGLYEKNETPYAHTPNDIIENLDVGYFHEVAKGSVGASLYFAGAHNYLGLEKSNTAEINIFPNPAKEYLKIKIPNNQSISELKLYSQNGMLALRTKIPDQNRINISYLQNGIYMLELYLSDGKRIVKKVQILN